MGKTFADFMGDESGATLIEYALVAGLISMAIVSTLNSFGGTLTNWFTSLDGEIVNATG